MSLRVGGRLLLIGAIASATACGGVPYEEPESVALKTESGPAPPREILDCNVDGNQEACIECNAKEGIACCWDKNCNVIRKAPKLLPIVRPATSTPATLPLARQRAVLR